MQDRLLRQRITEARQSILLLGPRQVGKSTLIKSLKPSLYVNLADEARYLAYSKNPSRLRQQVEALASPGLIAIDEVQRVPALLNTVQVLIDDHRPKHKYILTGSSARKLRRGGANLLPGRLIVEYMDPLLYSEVIEANSRRQIFDLDRALQVGMLPGIFLDHQSGTDLLESYVEIYLREEVLTEGLARNIGGFARLLDIVAVVSGQWLNYSKLSSDIEVPKETVRRYISLLEDTLVLARLGSFKPRRLATRRVSQRDRILLFDVGVRNAILGLHRSKLPLTEIGSVFEQWFILQVLWINRAMRRDWKISSFLNDKGLEVDLVVETDKEIIAVEVKSGRNIRKESLRGFNALREVVGRYKPVREIIAYQGGDVLKVSPTCVAKPYLEFLGELAVLMP